MAIFKIQVSEDAAAEIAALPASARKQVVEAVETQLRNQPNMKAAELAETNLERCVTEAGAENVLVVKNGKPLALVSNVQGLDAEQIGLGTSAEFWKLIEARRRQKTIPWEEIKKRMDAQNG